MKDENFQLQNLDHVIFKLFRLGEKKKKVNSCSLATDSTWMLPQYFLKGNTPCVKDQQNDSTHGR